MDIQFGAGSGRTFAEAVALVTEANTRLVQVGPSEDTITASPTANAKPGLIIQGNGDPVTVLNASAGNTFYIYNCGQGNRIENLNFRGALRTYLSSLTVRNSQFALIDGVVEPSAGYLLYHSGDDAGDEFEIEYVDTVVEGSGVKLSQSGASVARLLRFAGVEIVGGRIYVSTVERLEVDGLKISDWNAGTSTALYAKLRDWMIRDLEIAHSSIPAATTYGLRLEGISTTVADHVAGPVLQRMVVRDVAPGAPFVAVQIHAVWDDGLMRDCDIRTGAVKFRAAATDENVGGNWEITENQILHHPVVHEANGLHIALRKSRIHHNEIRSTAPHLLFVGDDSFASYYPAAEEFFGFDNEIDHNTIESYLNTEAVSDRDALCVPDKGRGTRFHDNVVVCWGSMYGLARCYSASGQNARVWANEFHMEKPGFGSPQAHAWINDLAWAGVQAAGNRYCNNRFTGEADYFAISTSGDGTGWSEDHNLIAVENIGVLFDLDERLELHATSFGLAVAATEPWRLDWGGDPTVAGAAMLDGYTCIGLSSRLESGACCGGRCRVETPAALSDAVVAGKLPAGGTARINVSSESDRALFDQWLSLTEATPALLDNMTLVPIG